MKKNIFSRFMGLRITVVMTSVLMALTLLGSSALAQPSRELLVVDANDIVIGVARSVDSRSATVAFEYMGKLYLFSINTFRFGGSSIYFESTDCSGTPYIRDEVDMSANVAVVQPGNIIYIPIPGSSSQTITHQSWSAPGNAWSDGKYCSPGPFPQEMELFPAQKVIELDTVFTPPFRVRFSD